MEGGFVGAVGRPVGDFVGTRVVGDLEGDHVGLADGVRGRLVGLRVGLSEGEEVGLKGSGFALGCWLLVELETGFFEGDPVGRTEGDTEGRREGDDGLAVPEHGHTDRNTNCRIGATVSQVVVISHNWYARFPR